MMVQLKRSGILSQLTGMIVGGFSDCEEASLQIGKDAYGIIAEHTQDFNYPIAFDFPAGHIPNNQPLLMGQKISLLINSTEVQLTYTNP
jgi:muramoyltetrapeptide carboxypeptidase